VQLTKEQSDVLEPRRGKDELTNSLLSSTLTSGSSTSTFALCLVSFSQWVFVSFSTFHFILISTITTLVSPSSPLLSDSSTDTPVYVAVVTVDAESAANQVAGGLRVAEAVAVLLQGRRGQVCRVNHWRQLQVHERIPRLYRASCHHSTHWQVTVLFAICWSSRCIADIVVEHSTHR